MMMHRQPTRRQVSRLPALRVGTAVQLRPTLLLPRAVQLTAPSKSVLEEHSPSWHTFGKILSFRGCSQQLHPHCNTCISINSKTGVMIAGCSQKLAIVEILLCTAACMLLCRSRTQPSEAQHLTLCCAATHFCNGRFELLCCATSCSIEHSALWAG